MARVWNQPSQFSTVQTEWSIYCLQVIMIMVATKGPKNSKTYQTQLPPCTESVTYLKKKSILQYKLISSNNLIAVQLVMRYENIGKSPIFENFGRSKRSQNKGHICQKMQDKVNKSKLPKRWNLFMNITNKLFWIRPKMTFELLIFSFT